MFGDKSYPTFAAATGGVLDGQDHSIIRLYQTRKEWDQEYLHWFIDKQKNSVQENPKSQNVMNGVMSSIRENARF